MTEEAKAPMRNLKTLVMDVEEKVYALSMLYGIEQLGLGDEKAVLADGVNITLNAVMERLINIDDNLNNIVKAVTNTSDLLG